MKENTWVKIMSYNIDKIDAIAKERIVIGWIDRNGSMFTTALTHCIFTLKSMAMQGGFYCYVLPNIEREE